MPRLTTTQQGLGWEHQRQRRSMPPPQGDPCPYCFKPMWPDMELDADHVLPRADGGTNGPLRWAHSACNRRDGARMKTRAQPIRSRAW